MESTLGPPFGRGEEGQTVSNGPSSAGTSHSEAVQALRKYLLRKMSSEDSSSGEKELDLGTTEKVISVAESDGSKLYCSVVERPVEDDPSQQGSKRLSLTKHSSLDLETSSSTFPGDLRYLRTDLCIPVLWSKCSFCDDFFENEEQLRKHLRDAHFQYFLNYIQMRPITSTKSLSDLPFSSALHISESSNGSDSGAELLLGRGQQKKPIQCDVCGKFFTTKWNCKQHLKGHGLKEGHQSGATTITMGLERSSSVEHPSSSSSSSLSTTSSSAM